MALSDQDGVAAMAAPDAAVYAWLRASRAAETFPLIRLSRCYRNEVALV